MDLSIVIVNYKSVQHVINCLKSIYESNMGIEFEVIIVDNDSRDNSKEIICNTFLNVIWIQSNYNAGFARANNMGIKISKGRNILLLNADTIVIENAIEKTMIQFDKQPQYAACGIQLMNPDGSNQHSGAKFIKGGLNILLPLPYLGRLIRGAARIAGVEQPNVFHVKNDIEVDWIIGAFIMTKKETIEKYGMLDEDFFMYAEEIEWCSRLREKGPMVLYSSPKVIHLGGGSSSDYYGVIDNDNSWNLWSKKSRQIILSQFLRVRKQWGTYWFILILFFYAFEIPLFIFVLTIDKIINLGKTKYKWSNLFGYIKNMMTIFPLTYDVLLLKKKLYKI